MDDRKYTEAQLAVLGLWETWSRNRATATYNDMREFYCWLEEHHGALLEFPLPPGADPWQEVRAWLNRRTQYGEETP